MGRLIDQKNTNTQAQTPIEQLRLSSTSQTEVKGRLTQQAEKENVDNEWNKLPFAQKFYRVSNEIPRTLYNFLPKASRDEIERSLAGENRTLTQGVTSHLKGAAEFAQITGKAVAEGVLGGVLSATEKASGYRNLSVDVPLLGEVGSWNKQVNDLKTQGFTENEAKALVGINSYLSVAPAIKPALKTKAAQSAIESVRTHEVPFANTLEGARQEAATGVKPTGTVRETRPAVQAIEEFIGTDQNVKKLQEIQTDHFEQFYENRNKLLTSEDPLNRALSKLSDSELKTYSNYTQGIVNLADTPSAEFQSAVKLWKKTNQDIEQYLIDVGELTKAQTEARRWKPVEQITGRTQQELQAMGVEPIYYPYLAEDFLSRTDFLGTTGRRTSNGYLKRFTGKLLAEDNYIKDPTVAIPRHRVQVFRDKMNGELVESVIKNFAEKDKKLIKKFKENPRLADAFGLAEWKPAGTLRFYPVKTASGGKALAASRKVESYFVPKSVAQTLTKQFRPGNFEKFMRMTYDPMIDMWRISVLNMTPRWIYNNFQGNLILSQLAGTGPIPLLKGLGVAVGETSLGKFAKGKLGIEGRKLPKGVLSDEFAGGEGSTKSGRFGSLPSETSQFMRPVENWLNVLEQAKQVPALRKPAYVTQGIIKGWLALGKPGGALNTVIENWFRSAIYIAKTEGNWLTRDLTKAVPEAEGINYVNEFLNNYSTNLTRAERATFRRALPFYNWMKFITKFSAQFPVNHPTRALVAQALLQEYVDYINEVDQRKDPIKSVLRLKLNDVTYEGKPMYLNIKSAIPFSEIFNTIPRNFETVGRFLTSNPISKIIIERGFRINSYTGQAFSSPAERMTFDEFGSPISPVPTLPLHVAQQFSQTKMIQAAVDQIEYGKVLKRYDTGEPKIYSNKLQTSDLMLEIMKYFGISVSPLDLQKIDKNADKKNKKQEKKFDLYEQRKQRLLDAMKRKKSAPLDETVTLEDEVRNAEIEANRTILSRTLQEIPNATVEVGKELLRAMPRAMETLALDIKGKELFTPTTPFEKFVFGTEPVRNIKGTGEQSLLAFGADKSSAAKYAVPMGFALTALDLPLPGPKGLKQGLEGAASLSTKTLERLIARRTGKDLASTLIKKEEVLNELARADVRQPEANLINNVLNQYPGDEVPFTDFVSNVRSNLTPLVTKDVGKKYEWRALDDKVRGDVTSYNETIYESPFQNTTGEIHFRDAEVPNYFAHVRTEKVIENGEEITRDIEIQSDLFQRNRLNDSVEIESQSVDAIDGQIKSRQEWIAQLEGRPDAVAMRGRVDEFNDEIKLLEDERLKHQSVIDSASGILAYKNNRWADRIINHRIQEVANKGGGKYRLPVGETAMKIEGLGEINRWTTPGPRGADHAWADATPENLKVGNQILMQQRVNGQHLSDDTWVITDVLGDGKFTAVPKKVWEEKAHTAKNAFDSWKETFDISGKVDTSNQIYKFYENDIKKSLARTGLEVSRVTDKHSQQWWEVDIPKDKAGIPVEAFGVAPLMLAGDFMSGIKEKYNELFSSKLTYQRQEDPQQTEEEAPTYVPSQYRQALVAAAAEFNVSKKLLSSIIEHETGGKWDPNLVGPTGDIGLGQHNPSTTVAQIKKLIGEYDPHNPIDSIRGTAAYLKWLSERPGLKTEDDVIKAYNLGPSGAVDLEKQKTAEKYLKKVRDVEGS